MLFSLTGEVGLVVIGLLWVCNKWFDSFIDMLELGVAETSAKLTEQHREVKNNDDQKERELPEAFKHMYS